MVAAFVLQAPLGPLFLAVTPEGLRRLDLLSHQRDIVGSWRFNDEPASTVPISGTAEAEIAAKVETQLQEYFEGARRDFDLPLDPEGGSEFQRDVWQAIARIPYGRVASYAEVAIAAGYPNAFRAVGSACGANPIAIVTPCHRVIASGGRLGGYGLGLETKVWLLRHEGVGCDSSDAAARVRTGGLLGV